MHAGLIQHPQTRLLAEQRGHYRHPKIDISLCSQLQLDAPVLGQPPFGDVQLGHDLYSRHHRVFHFERKVHNGHHIPIQAVSDAKDVLIGFDVDIAGAGLEGVDQDAVDQLDDGSLDHAGRITAFLLIFRDFYRVQKIADGLVEILHVDRRAFIMQIEFSGALQIVDGVVLDLQQLRGICRFRVFTKLSIRTSAIIFLDRFEQRRFAGDNGLDRVIGPKFEIVEAEDIGGIRHGDGQVRADPF